MPDPMSSYTGNNESERRVEQIRRYDIRYCRCQPRLRGESPADRAMLGENKIPHPAFSKSHPLPRTRGSSWVAPYWLQPIALRGSGLSRRSLTNGRRSEQPSWRTRLDCGMASTVSISCDAQDTADSRARDGGQPLLHNGPFDAGCGRHGLGHCSGDRAQWTLSTVRSNQWMCCHRHVHYRSFRYRHGQFSDFCSRRARFRQMHRSRSVNQPGIRANCQFQRPIYRHLQIFYMVPPQFAFRLGLGGVTEVLLLGTLSARAAARTSMLSWLVPPTLFAVALGSRTRAFGLSATRLEEPGFARR
jgi:hypothetical protein